MEVLVPLWICTVCLVFTVQGFADNTLLWCAGEAYVYHTNLTLEWLTGQQNLDVNNFRFGHRDTRLVAASFIYRHNYAVFSDAGTRTVIIYKESSTGAAYVNVGVSEGIGEIAVDWLNSNVYWCDSVYSWIGLQALPHDPAVSTFNDKQRIVVEKDVQKPHGIAVSPQQRYIFWTDYGETPRVERASLSGSERKVLVWTGLIRPLSITTDPSSLSLYWVDSARASVETCDFDGRHRRMLLQNLGDRLTGVAVFQEHLLYTEAVGKTINAVSKVTGEQSARVLQSDREPIGAFVFSESLQPFTDTSCDNHGCEHICILESGGPVCLCEGGYVLGVDGKSCSGGTPTSLWKSVIYSTGSKICAVPITTFNSFRYVAVEVSCLQSDSGISHLASDVHMSTVFYTTDRDIKKLTIGQAANTIITASNSITGLVYDPVQDTVIWSERDAGVIRQAGSDGASPSSLFPGLAVTSPSALAIDPRNRLLFWVSSTATPRIYKGNLTSGMELSVLVGSDLRQPLKLAFDLRRTRLYWTEDGRLGSIQTSGQGRTNFPLSPLPTYVGVMTFKGYLVWTAKEQSMNMTVAVIDDSDNTLATTYTFTVPGAADITDLVMYDTDGDLAMTSGCDYKNGGCDHVCLPQGLAQVCQCHYGYTLRADGSTCSTNVVSEDFFLVLDTVHNRVYQVGDVTDTSTVQAVDLESDNTPNITTYDSRGGRVIWYDSEEHVVMRAGLDGADEIVIVTTDEIEIEDMRVDPSTGNIFYTATTSGGAGSVRVVTQEGQGHILLQTQSSPGPLAIHPPSGQMAWGEDNIIKIAVMDGSGQSTLVSTDLDLVSDLDFDTSGDTLFVADVRGDKLESIVLRTRSRRVLRENTQEFPTSIAVKGDTLYYLPSSGRTIKAVNRTTGVELLSKPDVAQFGHLSQLYVYTETQTLANHACSEHNGGCSTFCLPTPSGKVCACAEDDALDATKTGCGTAVRCPAVMNNGDLVAECQPHENSVCDFTCDVGYEAAISTNVLCLRSGFWNISLNTLCRAIRCPTVVPNGDLSPTCDPHVNAECSFTCDVGYEATITSLVSCSVAGTWAPGLDTLCTESVEGVSTSSTPATGETSSPPVGAIVGGCVALVILLAVGVAVVLIMRRRKASTSRHKALTLSQSQQPIVKVEEIYDEVQHSQDDPRYLSFSRVRGVVEGAEIRNPVYDSTNYLTVRPDHGPLAPPRPANSFTPNTRKRMFRSESPTPDYDAGNSEADTTSYVDVV